MQRTQRSRAIKLSQLQTKIRGSFVTIISAGVSAEEVLQSLMDKTFESQKNTKSGQYNGIMRHENRQ